jgi:hypothetical protein
VSQIRFCVAVAVAAGALAAGTASAATIPQIQGPGHVSPFVGTIVSAQGIVTGKRTGVSPRGFYLQDPSGDADRATSDGIFVFTNTTPTVNVGDEVVVSGQVIEFRPGGSASANLTTTEFDRPTVAVVSSGNSVPAPTSISQPPTEVIDDDSEGSVETGGVFDPLFDGIDFYQTFEGMLVQVDRPVAVSARNRFGETAVISEVWTTGLLSPRGAIVVRAEDFNPERVIVDDENFRPLASTPSNDTATASPPRSSGSWTTASGTSSSSSPRCPPW